MILKILIAVPARAHILTLIGFELFKTLVLIITLFRKFDIA